MTTKRTITPATAYDPLYEELAKQVANLQKRIGDLERRFAVNPDQRNCSKCGRLVRGKRCTLCGGEAVGV